MRTDSPFSSKVCAMCEPINPAPPVTKYFILPACSPHDRTDRAQNNLDIHGNGAMFNIVQVVLQFHAGFGYACHITIVDLCPTGEARLCQEACPIKWNLPLV